MQLIYSGNKLKISLVSRTAEEIHMFELCHLYV